MQPPKPAGLTHIGKTRFVLNELTVRVGPQRGGGRGHESDPMYSSIKGKKVGWEHGRYRTSTVLHSTGTEHREAEQRIEPS